MLCVVNRNTGAVVHRTALSTSGPVMNMPPVPETIARVVAETGLNPADLLTWAPPDVETARALAALPPESLAATLEGGQVVEVGPAPTGPEIWLHLAITGGDSDTPPGVLNDGVDSLTVTAAIRAGSNPADPVVPLDGAWRITIRDDVGAVYDVVKVTLTAGESSVAYTTNGRTAVCQVLASDFLPVEVAGVTYRVRLAESAAFKVYREL